MENEESKKQGQGKMIVAVRVRGELGLSSRMKLTFSSLNLHNKNGCVLVEESPTVNGMLTKVKDFITWGPISPEVMKELVTKRGELYSERLEDSKSKIKYDKFIVVDGKKYKRMFRLSPPRKGFGRTGIKVSFAAGGALGFRGEKINDLVSRMI
jgi:large subunit ribosomal protein L30